MISNVGRVLFLWLPLLSVLSLGCRNAEPESAQEKASLILYCGAGIQEASSRVKAAFEAENPHIELSITYAGSGRLLGQLGASQKGDLYMPGSAFYVDKAIEKGWAVSSTRRNVAYFIPVIVVQKGNPLNIQTLDDLLKPGVRIGLGDERAVAIGKRAVAILEKNKVDLDAVARNLVYKSGTVNELGVAIQMKNVDAVIMWDANARHFSADGDLITIPFKDNIISTIPIVSLKFSSHPKEAATFIEFISSDAGKNIFKQSQYTIIKPTEHTP
jgi:molybdate transport system substrate-binding protein